MNKRLLIISFFLLAVFSFLFVFSKEVFADVSCGWECSGGTAVCKGGGDEVVEYGRNCLCHIWCEGNGNNGGQQCGFVSCEGQWSRKTSGCCNAPPERPTNTPIPTQRPPTPTMLPTRIPTSTPTPAGCHNSCVPIFGCRNNLSCWNWGGRNQCVNPSCADDPDCVCPAPTFTPTPTPTSIPTLTPTPTPSPVTVACNSASINPQGMVLSGNVVSYNPLSWTTGWDIGINYRYGSNPPLGCGGLNVRPCNVTASSTTNTVLSFWTNISKLINGTRYICRYDGWVTPPGPPNNNPLTSCINSCWLSINVLLPGTTPGLTPVPTSTLRPTLIPTPTLTPVPSPIVGECPTVRTTASGINSNRTCWIQISWNDMTNPEEQSYKIYRDAGYQTTVARDIVVWRDPTNLVSGSSHIYNVNPIYGGVEQSCPGTVFTCPIAPTLPPVTPTITLIPTPTLPCAISYPDQPALVNPIDGQTINNNTVNLSWSFQGKSWGHGCPNNNSFRVFLKRDNQDNLSNTTPVCDGGESMLHCVVSGLGN